MRTLFKTLYLSFCLSLVLFVFYNLYFAGKIIPGLKIGKIKITNDAKVFYKEFSSESQRVNVDVVFEYKGQKFVISGKEVDLEYNASLTTLKLIKIGRTGNIFIDSRDKLAALIKGLDVSPVYKFDSNLLAKKISEIEGNVNNFKMEPRYVILGDGTLIVTDSEEGAKLNNRKIMAEIVSAFDSIQSKNFLLPVDLMTPKFTKEELQTVFSDVYQIISYSPIVKFEDKTWTYTKEELLSFLSFKKENGSVRVYASKLATTKLVDELSLNIETQARGEVFKASGGRVIEFRPKSDGRRLDKEKFRRDFSRALLTQDKEVILSVSELKAPGDTNKYGIYALLGEGVSYFSHSIPGRIKNLSLASSRASGVLVPPGEIYSFNKSVGDISGKTGYDVAYIIKDGRTVLGEGGGVCQSSTTLFRAVLNAGLPVIKRTAHAYRVSYYEENSPAGLDATVFQPSVDFQFRNNTSAYVLVQSEVDLSKNMLVFRIYGTPDGRKVEITEPVITNVTPPPNPVYEEDSNLRKGVIYQIDFPAWGATVSFERKVTRNGEVILEDKYVSNYQPWRAVYVKGTKK